MTMNGKWKSNSLGAILLAIVAVTGLGAFIARDREAPPPDTTTATLPPEQGVQASGRHVASGWSIAADPREAVIEAARKAQAVLNGAPVSYLLVAPTVHYDLAIVLDEVKKQFGKKAKIHGVTSSIAVMTEEGLHRGPQGALGLLAVADQADMRYGVAGVKLSDFATREAAGSEAMRRAIRDADPAGGGFAEYRAPHRHDPLWRRGEGTQGNCRRRRRKHTRVRR